MTWRDLMGLPNATPQPLSPQSPQSPQTPTVGSFGDTENSGDRESAVEGEEAIQEATAERAAITEHDGGLPRPRAQAVAELAGQFYAHHWICPACRAGTLVGAGLHRPCAEGAELWQRYCQAAGRRATP